MKKSSTLLFTLLAINLSCIYAQVVTPDSSFGVNGETKISFGAVNSYDAAKNVWVKSDGNIIASGMQASGYLLLISPWVAELKPNGQLNPSFGSGGKSTFNTDSMLQSKGQSVVQPDGKILLSCLVTDKKPKGTNGPGEVNYFGVIRYKSNGMPDSSFGNNGLVYHRVVEMEGYPNCIALQPDGKIIEADAEAFTLIRFNKDGSIDSTFGKYGKASINFGNIGAGSPTNNIIVLKNNNILVNGTIAEVQPGPDSIGLAECRSHGGLSTTFGNKGKVTTGIGAPKAPATLNMIAASMAIQQNGKIVVVGEIQGDYGTGNVNRTTAVVRYNTNGNLDSSFNGNGIYFNTLDALSDIKGSFANGVAIQPDGNILVSEEFYPYGWAAGEKYYFSVIKLNTHGRLDTSYSTQKLYYFTAYNIALQPDGKLLVAGQLNDSANFNLDTIAILRFNATANTSPVTHQDIPTTSGVQKKLNSNEASNMLVYPNPVKDVMHIQTGVACVITVTNSVGKIMLEKTVTGSAEVNAGTLANGIYYVTNNTTGDVKKVVVLH